MQFQKYLTLLIILTSTMAFSQEKFEHKVEKGESVYSIAQKYKVKPNEILDLNPKAKRTLQLNMVLQIPNKANQNKPEIVSHQVLPKETLYGLSKKYNTSIDDIKKANPSIELEGLKVGTVLSIPVSGNNLIISKPEKPIVEKKAERIEEKKEGKKEEIVLASTTETGFHTVLTKETKYGISKKYGISIAELESLNPEIKNGLPVGFQLKIKKEALLENTAVNVAQNEVVAETKLAKKNKTTDKKEISEETKTVKPQIEEEETAIVTSSEAIQPEMPLAVVAPLTPENMTKAEFLVAKAAENLGARYRIGATGNGAFDCSGLMFATFKNIDLTLPRTSRDMAKFGSRIDKQQAQKGDLIFFATRGSGVSHVGMVTDVTEDEIKFIHSSTSSGVIYSSTKEPYYAKRFVQVNRVLTN